MSKKSKLSGIKAVGFDLDGVVYFGNKLATGAKKIIYELRQAGYRVFFITNNSSKTREEISMKLLNLDIEAKTEDILTSGYACALFLSKFKKKTRTLILGSDGLKKMFRQMGLDLTAEPKCDFLVVGYDAKFSYEKICLGLWAINKGAKFIACNLDSNFPGNKGKVFPGCGAMIAAITAASGKNPDFLIGKPDTYMLKLTAKRLNLRPEEIFFVGDSVETDISMADKFGSLSVLVNVNKQLRRKRISVRPSFSRSSLLELRTILRLSRQ